MCEIDMFKLYPSPEDYIPCNRKFPIKKEILTIMTGETTVHSFDIPFDVESDTLSYRLIYKLGLNIVLVKEKEDCEVLYDDKHDITTLTWTISPSETLFFRSTLLDAHAQIEFVMPDHSISYTDILEVKVVDSLNKGEV